ncbi:PEP-CTERM sorting domain-containing protein [bacterium]|nr:PEP-CTERM sorting domain-containing protein [bacterium]
MSSVDGIVFRNNGQGNSQNLGIDDLQIVPEPSSASLLTFTLSAILAFRRRKA